MKPLCLAFIAWFAGAQLASAELIRDVEYARPDGVSLTLDVNVPEGKGPFPIAILIHGGGFTNATKTDYITPLFAPLTDAKFTWFTINYRGLLSNSYPAWVEDVETSVRWVKAHAAEYKGDPKRVALIGESFGAYLAWLAAGRATNETKVNALVVFYGPFHYLEAATNGHLSPGLMKIYGIQKPEEAGKILHEASVPTCVKPGLPPVLLVHGTSDEKVPYTFSVEALQRLTEAKVPCELISVTNAPHGMMNWETLDPGYKTRMISWLQRTL